MKVWAISALPPLVVFLALLLKARELYEGDKKYDAVVIGIAAFVGPLAVVVLCLRNACVCFWVGVWGVGG